MTKIYEFPVNPQKLTDREKLEVVENLAFIVHDFDFENATKELKELDFLKYDDDVSFIIFALERLNEMQGNHETKVKKDDENIKYHFVNDIPIGITIENKFTKKSTYISKDRAIDTILLADDVSTALQYAKAAKESFYGFGDALFDHKIDNLIRLLGDAQ
ncbi:hypothetical protein ETI06_05655 [Macrococcoides goetzii]|nr:hypothetical protein [Macrococcus goetzii]TDM49959.1 hypothetical protein ETI06_05655 [Macrococcus goetzii]